MTIIINLFVISLFSQSYYPSQSNTKKLSDNFFKNSESMIKVYSSQKVAKDYRNKVSKAYNKIYDKKNMPKVDPNNPQKFIEKVSKNWISLYECDTLIFYNASNSNYFVNLKTLEIFEEIKDGTIKLPSGKETIVNCKEYDFSKNNIFKLDKFTYNLETKNIYID